MYMHAYFLVCFEWRSLHLWRQFDRKILSNLLRIDKATFIHRQLYIHVTYCSFAHRNMLHTAGRGYKVVNGTKYVVHFPNLWFILEIYWCIEVRYFLIGTFADQISFTTMQIVAKFYRKTTKTLQDKHTSTHACCINHTTQIHTIQP